jgi:hypothetical protein
MMDGFLSQPESVNIIKKNPKKLVETVDILNKK